MVPSSEPVTSNCSPLHVGHHELAKEVCPFGFFLLTAASQSQMAAVLSTAAENRRLRGGEGWGEEKRRGGEGR